MFWSNLKYTRLTIHNCFRWLEERDCSLNAPDRTFVISTDQVKPIGYQSSPLSWPMRQNSWQTSAQSCQCRFILAFSEIQIQIENISMRLSLFSAKPLDYSLLTCLVSIFLKIAIIYMIRQISEIRSLIASRELEDMYPSCTYIKWFGLLITSEA